MPHSTVPSPGLQALILCGPGVSLNTFTSNPNELPKALIPIANRPMVWYPLDWCHRMGVTNIALVTPAECAPALESALATHPALTSLPSPKPEVIAPVDLETTTGTGELLRLPAIQKHITSDFVVLPCDLITELDPTHLTQQWMVLNPFGGSTSKDTRKGGMAVFYSTAGLEGISHKKDETDFLATCSLPEPSVPPQSRSLRPFTEKVVWNMPTDTLNDKLSENGASLKVRRSLIDAHPRVKLRTKHRDAHVYIFPLWVKDFVAKNETFDSISEDVVGWWAKAGWQNGLPQKLRLDEILVDHKPLEESMDGSLDDDDINPMDISSTKSAGTEQQSSLKPFASRVGNVAANLQRSVPVPQILAYVQPTPSPNQPEPLIRRVDNAHQLISISLHLAKQPVGHVLLPEHRIHPTAQIGMQSRIAQEDCLIAENVKIGIRGNVKETVIGANCEIGNNVRLHKCLLMENVYIGDGVQLTGCIIGRRARIEGLKTAETNAGTASAEGGEVGSKSKGKKKAADNDDDDKTRLTDCEVAPNFVVEAGTEAKGEKLMAFDTEQDGDLDEDYGEDD